MTRDLPTTTFKAICIAVNALDTADWQSSYTAIVHYMPPQAPQRGILSPCTGSRAISFRNGGSKCGCARLRCRAEDGGGNGAGDALKNRLRAAEAEAEALRKQLAAAKSAQEQRGGVATEGPPKRPSRIDGAGLNRESPFARGASDWLSESDFSFFGAKGPGEVVDAVTNSAEEAAVVKRRLIIGVILTAVVAAISLLPTDFLRIAKPSKPLFFYLTPLVRIQALLKDLEQAAVDGEADEVRRGISSIQGAPNFAVENLRNAAAGLPDGRAAEKAGVIARDVIEYLDAIDYNKYFENLQQPEARSGEMQKAFLDFSLNSVRAAQAKLKVFLALMPEEQLEAARQQATAAF